MLPVLRTAAALLAAAGIALLSAPAAAAFAPEPVSRTQPDYPAEAAGLTEQGVAKAKLVVDAKGRVSDVTILDETPAGHGFGAAAAAALRQWTFKPGRPGTYVVTLQFEPNEAAPALPSGLMPPLEPVKRVNPRYPVGAEVDGINGAAKILATIDGAGKVTGAVIVGEVPSGKGFGTAARDAVLQWEFAPGRPGQFILQITFGIEGMTPGVNWGDLKQAPKPSHRVAPLYPPAARAADRNGRVRAGLAIAADGSVAWVQVVDERPKSLGFGQAAYDALMQWRFDGAAPGIYRITLEMDAP